MFFDNISQIPQIAKSTGCSIFVLPQDVADLPLKTTLILQPEDKSTITIEQIREITTLLAAKQSIDQFIVIRPADALNESAANALLKNLEEPKNHYHFVLITQNPSKLLPTILSRSQLYFLRTTNSLDAPISADDKIKTLAKQLIVAQPKDYIALAETITKKKDNTRAYTLEILAVAIEMLYKTYFLKNDLRFLEKIPKFLQTYQNIEQNGHIKLHLVADLL